MGWDVATPQLAVAAGALVLAERIRIPVTKIVTYLSSLSLGIYLVHPIIISVLTEVGIDGALLIMSALSLSHITAIILSRIVPRAVT